ncbi:MAG: cell division protein FtsZ [Candidatus Cloacimonetes bacterium]|jgi:cell division protein FtsZ|nr:cell division protein FtsZ [Candidatus Cloacimonadota bacterium]MCB5287212.1 cell division protein FtsZ [Candidatus Cloacimonadota bacterium]MCK9184863.1 cell division protein FtsZ [Candidatus Cloacimonadota bacterium]MCK9583322.1 cell division protein FtsZ [Candidatus Cloacimonadota bacterium]MDY0229533.1 cell division protein FtsZ [Candidatus Cloacimonadaceae bacterium]
MIEFDDRPAQLGTNIKVIGVGGAGGNAINTMIKNGLNGVEFIAANTDADDLTKSQAKMKLQLGKKLTRGLGTGANPETGSRSAEESKDEIKSHLEGADMIFLAAGMGGGTGTGATPIIAKIAREMGILTLGIVTTPFPFEGQKRQDNADHGIRHLSEYVDTLIVIPNEKLCEIFGNATLITAFNNADDVLYEAAKAVSDIITITGLINVDFADVKAVMQNMGYALMGTGLAEGDGRAINAARAAIDNPLLSDISLAGCQSLLLNITAGDDILMSEIEDVSKVIVNETGSDANIIMGVIMEESMAGKISVTLIATGLDKDKSEKPDSLLDFPKFNTNKTMGHDAQPPSPKDEIGTILKTLGINSQSTQDKANNGTADDPNRIKPMRTDVPSFLKALD